MANTIRIKRRTAGNSGAPATLANAELAFNEVDNTLYYGKGDNGSGTATSVVAIAGDGTFATKSYVDSAVASATPTGVAYLAQDNTWDATKTNTFNGTVNLEGTFQIDAVTVLTSAAELNVLDGAASNTVVNSKAVIYGSAGQVAAATLETTGDLTVGGNLKVSGTTTTVNSVTMTVKDPLITLGGGTDDAAPATDDNKDRGVAFRWHTGSAAKLGFFGWDDSAQAFTVIPDATITGEVVSPVSGSVADALFGKVNNVTIGASSTTAATLTIGSGKTATISNTLTFTGTDSSSVAFGAGGTVAYTSNTLAVFAATTSAQLAGVISDETGSGSLVFATSPTLVTPTLGVASATSINKVTITAPATGSTLTIADGKTLTASNTLTFTGTDSSSVAFGTGGTVAYIGSGNAFTGANTFTNATGQTFRQAANYDGIILQGRAGGTSNYAVTFTSATLSASRTLTLPNEDGTVLTSASKLSAHAATTSAELAGVISDETGTGALVFATSPTLVTPTLGVASATTINKVTLTAPATGSTLTIADGKTLTASNTLTFTGTDSSSVAFGAGGTVAYTSNNLSAFAATTSSQLAGVISDETGSGSLVFATSPTLVTPTLGVASATSINKVAITAPATSATLTIADGKTLTASNTLTFTGTDSSSVAFGAGGTVAYTSNKLSAFAATTSSELAGVISDETGTGVLVFNASPTFNTAVVAGTLSLDVFNTTATTINAFGAVQTLNIGTTLATPNNQTINIGTAPASYTSTINIGTAGSGTSNVNLGKTGGGTVTVNNDLTVSGNLIVGGSTITVNTETMTIQDPLITLGGGDNDAPPTADDNKDRGVLFRWHNGSAAKIGFFGWDDSAQAFTVIPDATVSSEVVSAVSNSVADVLFGKVNNVTIGASSTTAATLTIGSGKTATISNTLTFTGTDSSSVAFGAGGTVAYTSNKLSAFAATTSAELAGVISDETGSGSLVFATSPTLVTPVLGVATATSVNKVAITAPATGSTLTIADGKTLTASNTLTFTGTDSSSVAFGAGGTVAYLGTANAFTGANTFVNATGQTFRPAANNDGILILGRAGGSGNYKSTLAVATLAADVTHTLPATTGTLALLGNKLSDFAATTSAELAGLISDETGTGALVFANTPTLVTPNIGVATATSVNKVAITAPATSATLTIANGKTLTCNNTLTFTGTDSSSVAFGAGGTVVYESSVCTAIANCTLDGGTF